MPADSGRALAIPLSGWADAQLAGFITMTGMRPPPGLTGAGLLVERAVLGRFVVPGLVSAGGGCRLIPARDGWIALNLARPEDRTLLPALFCDGDLDADDDDAIASRCAMHDAARLLERGREMGLAIASVDERPVSPPLDVVVRGLPASPGRSRPPLVIDLSALWAGPLATHLLSLAGARVVKVESRTRPDAMRDGDPALFALLNQEKASVAVDLRDPADRAALIALIERADIVMEAARPRALLQAGIDADAIMGRVPGLVWTTITGHGVRGQAGDWVGFGDDCAIASGLGAAMLSTCGRPAFVGDAIADPLTGIAAAAATWAQWTSGKGARLMLSMSATARAALDTERERTGDALDASLRQWAAAAGQPLVGTARSPAGPLAPFGHDTADWLRAPC
ncbi:MAG: CoA transferase [Sphingobium sp.]